MNMTGSRIIAVDRATVWKKLNDPHVLRACIPGCEELIGSLDEGYEATVKQKVGPVRATFRGAVQISDVVPGERYRITGEGKGGVAGFATGGALVTLVDVDGGTELTYDVAANVGGKIAQLGSRLIDGFARKMADQFFDRFCTHAEATSDGTVP
jgi:carbon monoxide dehydrogenase subunit G